MKKDIVEGKLECPKELAIDLAALALQCTFFLIWREFFKKLHKFSAEFGNYEPDEHTAAFVSQFLFYPRAHQDEQMEVAMTELSRLLLTLQGDGDYEGVVELTESRGIIKPQLQGDLDRLTQANIPVDITFLQGTAELGID